MSLIDWALYTERAVGRGSGSYADVINRPLREVLTVSGYDPDQDFAGFAKTTHTHDASAIATGTLSPARGGTGLSNPTAGGLLVAAAALAMTLLAPGASGQVVKSNGIAWGSAAIVTADVSDLASAATGITKVGTLTQGAIGAGFTAIVDTALATISSAGKVANSATTATNLNTASAIVARDASGNFSAGTITAALAGNASTATQLATPRAINGVNFDGTAAITIKATATNALTIGAHLTGVSYDGSAPITIATDATSANTASAIVARDGSGNFSAGTITATSFSGPLAGNAATATKLAAAVNINGVAFDGSVAITVPAAANTLTGTALASNVVTSSLTAVGTIATGVWQGTVVAPAFGGTGVANANTITLGGNISTASAFTTAGAFGLTLTVTGVTNVTLPTSGTLVNTAVATLSNLTTIGTLGALNVTGVTTLTSTSAVALAVGANGATNPAFQVDASATSAATGLKVTANAATGGLALAVISSALNDALSIDAKGTGTITLGGTSTGAITLGQSTTIASGKTLTLTGTTVAGAPTWSSNQAITLSTAAQPNVTSLGTLTSLTVSGAVTAANYATSGAVALTGWYAAANGKGLVVLTLGGANKVAVTLDSSDTWQFGDGRPAVFNAALTVSAGGFTVSAGGLTVSAGTTSVQALTATLLNTASGSTSMASGTFTTVYTMATAGVYEVRWYLSSGANAGYFGQATIIFDGFVDTVQSKTVGAFTDIQLSTTNIQLRQSSGGTGSIVWSITRLA
jgi:hypothetical protein